MSDDSKIVYATVAFRSEDREAWKVFWDDIRERYRFASDVGEAKTVAFAVSASDMFRTEEIIETILDSELGPGEKLDAIGDVFSYADPEQVLVDYEIAEASK